MIGKLVAYWLELPEGFNIGDDSVQSLDGLVAFPEMSPIVPP